MDRDLDDAIDTAAIHAREAEERLVETPLESPDVVVEAHKVYRRTEDLSELASDAAHGAEAEPQP